MLTYPGWSTGNKHWLNKSPIYVREPIAMTEYACRIANIKSIHVIQLDDCVSGEPEFKIE